MQDSKIPTDRQTHRENESQLSPPYITLSLQGLLAPGSKQALPKLSRISPHPEEGCVCPLGGSGALFYLHEGTTLVSGVCPTPAILQNDHYPIHADGNLPDLLLADVGGSPAEVLDHFRHFHTWGAELS